MKTSWDQSPLRGQVEAILPPPAPALAEVLPAESFPHASVAWRTLCISLAALTLAFAVWFMWSAIVVSVNDYGFRLTAQQKFWLTASPVILGSLLRIPYGLLVSRFGSRNAYALVTVALLVPCFGTGIALQNPANPFWLLLFWAGLTGIAGANFATSMATVTLWFPKRLQGTALGLNGLGNLGVTLAQFTIPATVAAVLCGRLGGQPARLIKEGTAQWVYPQHAAFMWIPFILLCSAAIWFGTQNFPQTPKSLASQLRVCRDKHTWILAFLYFLTFGAFVAMGASLPLIIREVFASAPGGAPNPLTYSPLALLVATLLRPVGGWAADRLGGGRVTALATATMALGGLLLSAFLKPTDFAWFFGVVLVICAASGLGNGSVFKIIPSVNPQEADRIDLKLRHAPSGLGFTATWQLAPDQPECTVALEGLGPMPTALKYPHPFVSAPGDYVIVPLNEGLSYPVEDETIEPMRLVAYGGHGLCMRFWGVTDGARGHMAVIETPDDAAIRIDRVEGRLDVAPEWEAQKGQFGYERRLRYIFFENGGHVALCKRYRAYARQRGLLRTLLGKRASNPNVDLLVGAANVWCSERQPFALAQEMKGAGLERLLWNSRSSPDDLRRINALGLLTIRGDLYQDVMNPEHFAHLPALHPDWPTGAWSKDLVLGPWYACGVLCDRRALDYARQRILSELAAHPYGGRCLAATTTSPWWECHSAAHPATRTESRRARMELLQYVSDELKQVTGSETGHEAAVPFVHYFEGLMSLAPDRAPEPDRDAPRIGTEAPESVARFQLAHRYRLPLWELVYHDCVVAHWHRTDGNNTLPALWDQRDLFNLLYGTPPLFLLNRALWETNQAQFVQSYRAICPVARAVGYSEMLRHRFLTPDRNVQQTLFANGVMVTVNFGHTPYEFTTRLVIPPLGFHVIGLPGSAAPPAGPNR